MSAISRDDWPGDEGMFGVALRSHAIFLNELGLSQLRVGLE